MNPEITKRFRDRPQYEKRYGSFYLIEKCEPNPVTNPDGERIICMADQIAIAFDVSMPDKMDEPILMKHGDPERVQAWAADARQRYLATGSEFARQMADGLRVVLLPRDFPVEEINHCLNNISYLGEMLKKHFPEALASTT